LVYLASINADVDFSRDEGAYAAFDDDEDDSGSESEEQTENNKDDFDIDDI
jgi:flagellar biosynthesis/type III secretory pathway M-ring protein FliF/YscJ